MRGLPRGGAEVEGALVAVANKKRRDKVQRDWGLWSALFNDWSSSMKISWHF